MFSLIVFLVLVYHQYTGDVQEMLYLYNITTHVCDIQETFIFAYHLYWADVPDTLCLYTINTHVIFRRLYPCIPSIHKWCSGDFILAYHQYIRDVEEILFLYTISTHVIFRRRYSCCVLYLHNMTYFSTAHTDKVITWKTQMGYIRVRDIYNVDTECKNRWHHLVISSTFSGSYVVMGMI